MNSSRRFTEHSISHILLAVALISASALVFPGLASSPLDIDEHVSYWIAGAENPGTLWERSANYAATPPLSSLVQRWFLELFGKSQIGMRLPSALGFLGAIAFTFVFARDMLGPLPAGLAVQLLVWHPDVLDQMRQARPYGLSVGLAAGLMWLTGRWCRSPRNRWLMLFWTVDAVALVWTHYLNLPLVGLTFVWLCGIPHRVSRWNSGKRQSADRFQSIVSPSRLPAFDGENPPSPGWPLFVALGLFALSMLPLLPSLFRLQEWSSVLNYRTTPPAWWTGLGPYWWLTLPIGVCGGWLLTRAMRAEPTEVPLRRHLAVLLLIGCVPVVVFSALPAGSLAALAVPRYRLIYAPATAVLLAGFILHRRNWIAALVATAVGIGGAWWVVGVRPWYSKELSVPAADDWTKLTVELQNRGQSGEPVFVYSGLVESRLVPAMFQDPMFHDYVACRAGRFIVETPHPRFALPWIWSRHEPLLAFYSAQLRQSLAEGVSTVWLIGGIDTDLGRETVERFASFVSMQRYRQTDRIETPNAVLVRFERRVVD